MIDVASGGALMDKTPTAARHLISNMASSSQQFGIKGASSFNILLLLFSIGFDSYNGLSEKSSFISKLFVEED
ncbi:hypothetical protein CR513_16204, partial [Mucuna pruriens]